MKTLERWFVYPLCGIAILISLCAASWNISADESGFVVGVLGVLVTALVGWQVFNAIESSKIIRSLDTLRSRFERQSNLLEAQDQRSRNLIEAFAEERRGDAESVLTAKYMCYLNSIHLFLIANVPPANQYLSQVELALSTTLQAIEHTTDKTTRQMFIEHQTAYAEIYNQIMVAIHQRQDEWQVLHERMIAYRNEYIRVSNLIIQGQNESTN